IKMEEISLANLDTNKLEAIAQEIYVDLIEDSCLGFCFEVHRAVKCGYFYLEFAETGSVKDFAFSQWKIKEHAASRFAPFLENPGMGLISSCNAHPQNFSSCNMRESESDQDNNIDRSCGLEKLEKEKKTKKKKKKGKKKKKPLNTQSGEFRNSDSFISMLPGISFETLGRRSCASCAPCHTMKCTRSPYCPQCTGGQLCAQRINPLVPQPFSLPDVKDFLDDSLDKADGQALIIGPPWDCSSDL
uniref:Uncharacterized protein n=1 Tax=Mustela putorius furo TaxID=9669 RepID=M3Z1A9_MUSPF